MSAAGYDFGSKNSYVALLRNGVIDTIDNDMSYRATPTAVSFTSSMRLTGNLASSQTIMNFQNTFFAFKNLIGLLHDDPVAQFEMQHAPVDFIKMDDGTVGVSAQYLGNPVVFSISQLVTMMVSDLKKTTLMHTPTMPPCVFSVPNYFTECQRRSFLAAIEAADITPGCLISDTLAVCLNYVLYKADLPKIGEVPHMVAFVDVGYSSTQVCIASFNERKVRVQSSLGSNCFGGRIFDRILCEKFCSDFHKQHGLSIKENGRAYLKLLNESEKVKKKLSGTTVSIPANVECIMNDVDFNSKVCRDEFDVLCEELYTKFRGFLISVLQACRVSVDKIDVVETVGGSSRIPGLKKIISEVFGKEISTTMNLDEAVVRGCAIKSAFISRNSKIYNLEVTDAMTLNYSVLYDGKDGEQNQLMVYGLGYLFPAKSELVFPPNEEFTFIVSQTDAWGNVHQVGHCKSVVVLPLDFIPEKLAFHVNVDSSGIFSVLKAFVFARKTQEFSGQDPDLESNNNEAINEAQETPFEFQYSRDFTKFIPNAQNIEKEMLAQIKTEKDISDSKNELEDFIYSSKDKYASIYRPYITNEEFLMISEMLSKKQEWLSGDGERQPAQVYKDHLKEMKDAFLPFKSRSDNRNRIITDIGQRFRSFGRSIKDLFVTSTRTKPNTSRKSN
ncbi:Heat shock 70 kDa protein 4L [Thelohanellus kitauei]|uniref:Heat shock 70 kDa protein 4L n=1 Tax=Thelohanellus kitauei TaxID=669202 RepID=A0A0C2JE92_THEKT|nr:Heat shock 70 kDa protein 4L [Thelohanellus kitauei]